MFDGLQHLAETGELTCVVRCQGSPGRRSHGVTHPGVGPVGSAGTTKCDVASVADISAWTWMGAPLRRKGCPARPLTQCSARRRLTGGDLQGAGVAPGPEGAPASATVAGTSTSPLASTAVAAQEGDLVGPQVAETGQVPWSSNAAGAVGEDAPPAGPPPRRRPSPPQRFGPPDRRRDHPRPTS